MTGTDRRGGPAPPPPRWFSRAEHTRLVRLCATIVRDTDAAEDLAQETLLEAWRHRDKLIEPTGAQQWLNAIARNVCRRWLSARSRATPTLPDKGAASTACGDVEAVLEREDLAALLDRALGLLPAPTRDALVAHYIEEHSHAEIAGRLGISADAVSMRLSRGKLQLRHLLETTFAEDVVAEGWARRGDMGWRPTRLRCVDCGRAAVELRMPDDEPVLEFRCRACDPHAPSVRLPLDTPVFADVVGTRQRPSAIQARTSDWAYDYWSPTQQPAWADCVRCLRRLPIQPYTRPGFPSWGTRHGWYVHCDSCGEQTSGSLAGVALALPVVRAARSRQPRLRAVPVREVERDGQPAMVVAFSGPDRADEVAAVFARDTYRLMHVSGPSHA